MERELLALDPEERKPFMDDLASPSFGRPRSWRRRWRLSASSRSSPRTRRSCGAWLVPRGANAVEAAGRVHTDLARGFIRAEVVAANDLLSLGSSRRSRPTGS